MIHAIKNPTSHLRSAGLVNLLFGWLQAEMDLILSNKYYLWCINVLISRKQRRSIQFFTLLRVQHASIKSDSIAKASYDCRSCYVKSFVNQSSVLRSGL